MSKLYSKKPEERIRHAMSLHGRTVRLVSEPVRGSGRTYELVGELVSVAHSTLGSGTYLAVVRITKDGRFHDEASSLAAVVSIEEVDR